MANVKITELTELAAVDVADNDVLPIVDVGGDTTKKITIESLKGATSAANDFITFTQLNANINVVSANTDAVETRRVANVTLFTNEDTALQARLTTNVSAFTTEDTALQARITANTLVAASNDFITFTRLNSNVNVVSANVTAVESRRAANVVLADAAEAALQARLTTNVSAFTTEDTALQARIAANTLVAASNDFITFTRLNANIDLVQDNVASVTVGTASDTETRLNANLNVLDANADAIEARRVANVTLFTNEDTALQVRIAANAAITTAVEARRAANLVSATFTGQVNMSDDLVVSGNLTVNGATTTVSTTNLDVEDRVIMLADGVSGSPSADVGILFNRGNQGNAAIFYDESAKTFKFSDTKDPKSNTSLSPVTASNISVGILDAATIKYDGADLNTAISTNVSTLSTEATAIQARLTTNVGITTAVEARRVANVTVMTDEDTALQARITANAAITTAVEARRVANVTVMTDEDTALQARIAANSVITTAVEARRVANIAGAVSSITTGNLTASRALVSDGSGKVAVSTITSTELGRLDGVSSAIQTQLDAKQASLAGATLDLGAL